MTRDQPAAHFVAPLKSLSWLTAPRCRRHHQLLPVCPLIRPAHEIHRLGWYVGISDRLQRPHRQAAARPRNTASGDGRAKHRPLAEPTRWNPPALNAAPGHPARRASHVGPQPVGPVSANACNSRNLQLKIHAAYVLMAPCCPSRRAYVTTWRKCRPKVAGLWRPPQGMLRPSRRTMSRRCRWPALVHNGQAGVPGQSRSSIALHDAESWYLYHQPGVSERPPPYFTDCRNKLVSASRMNATILALGAISRANDESTAIHRDDDDPAGQQHVGLGEASPCTVTRPGCRGVRYPNRVGDHNFARFVTDHRGHRRCACRSR